MYQTPIQAIEVRIVAIRFANSGDTTAILEVVDFLAFGLLFICFLLALRIILK